MWKQIAVVVSVAALLALALIVFGDPPPRNLPECHFAFVERAAVQSIADSTVEQIDWDTIVGGVGGLADLGAAVDEKVEIQRSAWYEVAGFLITDNAMSTNDVGQLAMTPGNLFQYSVSGTNNEVMTFERAGLVSLTVGEFVIMTFFQNSGLAWDTETSATRRPRLSVRQVTGCSG